MSQMDKLNFLGEVEFEEAVKFAKDVEVTGSLKKDGKEILTGADLSAPDWNQNDETAPDYIKNRTHWAESIKTDEYYFQGNEGSFDNSYNDGYCFRFTFGPEDSDRKKFDLNKYQPNSIFNIELTYNYSNESKTITASEKLSFGRTLGSLKGPDEYGFCTIEGQYCIKKEIDKYALYIYQDSSDAFFINYELTIQVIYEDIHQLDEKYIPTVLHSDLNNNSVSQISSNAIGQNSIATGFNTLAGSFAYTVTALDPVAKTFTLDSVEGLEVDDIYTVDLSFYKADGTATEELYANYGKITEISDDNVVTVDTFPSDVVRYRVPDEPYIDENGLDGEENVFRVIAKPNVGNRAIGTKSFAMGNGSQALSKNSVAMGKNCIAYGAHSVAIGYDNKTTHTATSFGKSNTASGLRSVAIGDKNTSSGSCTIAIGLQNTSTTDGAVAMGILNKANTRTSIALGERNTADGKGAIALGYKNTSSGERAFAAGHSNKVEGMYSIALGYNNISKGEGSTAFGNSNTSSNKGSFASGTGNKAIGTNSFALGSTNRATDKCSIALGYNNTSSGEGSIAFGNSNTSSNKGSFASGTGNKATGTNSFALGSTNRATGTSSFAHGYNNDATQTASAVFGTNSKSQGESSFAAGADVAASGHYSQAFGHKTKATGDVSFAEGEGTIANGIHQHVQGSYNIEDTDNEYAHIVGNGTSYKRSNAYTLDWYGNAWFAGNITAANIPEVKIYKVDGLQPGSDYDGFSSYYTNVKVNSQTDMILIDLDPNYSEADDYSVFAQLVCPKIVDKQVSLLFPQDISSEYIDALSLTICVISVPKTQIYTINNRG